MLIEFKVANFRSIREEQVFSFVANKADKELENCLIQKELLGLSGVKFLKGAVIYGANASGKSNILNAIRFLQNFVEDSATKLQPKEKTGTEPFKLDAVSKSKPSEFEITFVTNETRYVFGVSVTPQRVVEEYLVAYPNGVPQRWYTRVFNNDSQSYDWTTSPSFEHDKSLQDKTRENSLFLSVGPQFNHAQLTPVYNWFSNSLNFIRLSADHGLKPQFTAGQLKNPEFYGRIINLLKSADIGISNVKAEEKTMDMEELKKDLPKALVDAMLAIEAEMGKQDQARKYWDIRLAHKTDNDKEVLLDFNTEESSGTRRFFSLIGPWIDILHTGETVFIDEIETSLHPILVRELLELLFSDKNNPKGAQIVFTTHNALLLDNTLMRRDQIWFTEKTSSGTTRLYPLTDFQPRKDEALAKGYLAGRYGAIPYLPEGLKL